MRRSLAALVIPLILAACGSSPPTHYFTLTEAGPSGGHVGGSSRRVPLQVRDIQLPAALDRQQMVLRGPGAEVQVLGEDTWAGPLPGLMRNALTQDLRARLGESAVLPPGAPTPSSGVQVLILTVQQFSADTAGQVTLDTDWAVGRGNPPKPAISRHATIHVNAGSGQPDAVAQGMSKALGELAGQIAGAL